MFLNVQKSCKNSTILLLLSLPFYLTILKTTEGAFWVIVDSQSVSEEKPAGPLLDDEQEQRV